MEDMGSLWCYQENMDEMREKLLYTSLELENLKVETGEEIRKNKEYVKQLLQLLRMACQERDEARDQFQKLLNKVTQAQMINNISHVQVDNNNNSISPLMKSTKANSSITESNSFSETYNYHSHNSSSPVESFFEGVSSPELSNINMADSNAMAFVNHQPSLAQDCNLRVANNCLVQNVDQASLVIDSLVKGQPFPQQGKFLQAVLEAGPLLQTLLVAGPLPRWRNPPQLKPFNIIPPVSIKGCEAEIAMHNSGANLSYPAASRTMHPQSYFEMSCGSSRLLPSTSMLNFANSASGSCFEDQRLMSSGANMNSFVHLGKKQRLQ